MRRRTYEELEKLTASQAKQITDQGREIAELTERLEALERLIGQNSRNSSRPPSADKLERSVPRSTRTPSTRKPGKQPGAAGFTLRRADTADHTIDYYPDACRGCGGGLHGAAEVDVKARQVHDIPRTSILVTEHRLHTVRCRCGKVTAAPAPAGVNTPVQYGPNLRALACYLVVFQHIPVHRAAQAIRDITGAGPSVGWISKVVADTAALLAPAEQAVTAALKASPLLHVDETSVSVNGVKWWLHVASTEKLTAYHLNSSRGRVAVDELGVLPGYSGTVVHDSYAVYDGEKYATARHGLCGAHLRREITAASETPADAHWAAAALDAFTALNNAAHQARDDQQLVIAPAMLAALTRRWDQAVLVGLATNPAKAGREQSKTRNLLTRLRDRRDQVLLFSQDLSVSHTNNQAERDVRPAKTQMKISGCHRSQTGGKAWLTIRGHISTLRKNSINILGGLQDAITGTAWTPARC